MPCQTLPGEGLLAEPHEGHRMGDTHTVHTWATWYPQPMKPRGQSIVQQPLWEHVASLWLLYRIGWWSPERYVPPEPVNVNLFGKRVFVDVIKGLG